MANLCTKSEASSFSHSGDILGGGGKLKKTGYVTTPLSGMIFSRLGFATFKVYTNVKFLFMPVTKI